MKLPVKEPIQSYPCQQAGAKRLRAKTSNERLSLPPVFYHNRLI